MIDNMTVLMDQAVGAGCVLQAGYRFLASLHANPLSSCLNWSGTGAEE